MLKDKLTSKKFTSKIGKIKVDNATLKTVTSSERKSADLSFALITMVVGGVCAINIRVAGLLNLFNQNQKAYKMFV